MDKGKSSLDYRDKNMIGWEGGQPITLKDGTKLAAGFSGIRGFNDLEIVVKAVAKAEVQ